MQLHNISLTCLQRDFTGDVTAKSSFDEWWTRHGNYNGQNSLPDIWEIAFECGKVAGLKRTDEKAFNEGKLSGYKLGYDVGYNAGKEFLYNSGTLRAS